MTEIYKITCQICNKIYVGKHKVNNRLLNNYFGSGKLQKQHLKKHKKENQIKKVILYCEDNDVKYYEEKLIELYDATNTEIGLNVSKKSKGVHEHTKESKEKISKNHRNVSGENNPMYNTDGYWNGKHHSEKTKEKQRQAKLGKNHPFYNKKRLKHSERMFGENNPMFGKKQSNETINKKIKAQQKPVDVYKNDKYIETFESIKQAGEKLNINRGNISNVLTGRYKFAGGFNFKYKELNNG